MRLRGMGVCPKQRPPWSQPVLLPTAVTHRRVRAGGGMSLAAVCDGFYAQKTGAEEPGTWGGEAAGKSQPSLNKHRGWSHGDGREGRTSLPWGSATLLLCVRILSGISYTPLCVRRRRGFIITPPAGRKRLWRAIVRVAELTREKKRCSPGGFK